MTSSSSDEAELLAGHNRLKVLLGCTKGIVFEFDDEGRYVGVWTHDERLLARPRSELLGKTIGEVLGPEAGARDAVGAGGRLILRTERLELDKEYCASREMSAGQFVRIVAADNGVGMDEATRARVFEPFFTTKELGKGTGLGLSTVYGIVKQSGGHIELASAPGEGSLYLPHAPLPQPVVSAPEPPQIRRPIGSPTVLVAEDDQGVRTLIYRYLKRSGYEVVLASSGDEAIMASKGRAIDLLVTDMVMPGISGDRLAIQLREERPDLGILYISGYPDAAEVALLDHSLFLRKPFTRQDLVSRLETLLAATDDPRHHHASTGNFGGMLDEVDP